MWIFPKRVGSLEKSSKGLSALITEPEWGKITGKYYDRGTVVKESSSLSYSHKNALDLWNKSVELTELEHEAMKKELSGTLNGQFLDNPKFLPIFAEAERLDVPLYLHPGYPTNEEKDFFFKSESYNKMLENLLSTFGWGWHMDQGLQMVRLIFSGIFDKFPNLKLISGHWGEFVPNFIERLDWLSGIPGIGLKRQFSEYYRDNVYVTPSGMFTKPQFDLALAEMGADHILYSEDYPYLMREGQVKSFFDQMLISPEDKEKIAYKNVEKLFKL